MSFRCLAVLEAFKQRKHILPAVPERRILKAARLLSGRKYAFFQRLQIFVLNALENFELHNDFDHVVTPLQHCSL